MNLRIRKYNWHSAPPQIRGIRQRVFVEEQNVPPELEWDVTDQSGEHFLVVVDGNKAAATARLYGIPGATGFIGRHRLSDVRLLIQNDKALTQRQHGLVELMRRVL
ncbi:GNAT family N-acetyltransferase [Marinobacter gelidimuriae]|uniref:hypothetical protein n=1 Tax=Marinobacter gelidimuriae TaxID=2739064 RepID=UPI00037797B5|nr:hypothetical protein [Marinobacter gelidimuriae]